MQLSNAQPRTRHNNRRKTPLTAAQRRAAKELLHTPQDFMDSPRFDEADAERALFDDAPEIHKPDPTWYKPAAETTGAHSGKERPKAESFVLTKDEERSLFLRYNFARRMVHDIQTQTLEQGRRAPTITQARGMLRWKKTASELRVQIANSNLALVLAMAKRIRTHESDYADMISEGNMALLRAIDKFDVERGFKFSTYACRAILKAFGRYGGKQSKHRERFVTTEFDPVEHRSNYIEIKRRVDVLETADELKEMVLLNKPGLSGLEQEVLEHRFALRAGDFGQRKTLEEVGRLIGVTKERVRQIQNRALGRLREAMTASIDGDTSPAALRSTKAPRN